MGWITVGLSIMVASLGISFESFAVEILRSRYDHLTHSFEFTVSCPPETTFSLSIPNELLESPEQGSLHVWLDFSFYVRQVDSPDVSQTVRFVLDEIRDEGGILSRLAKRSSSSVFWLREFSQTGQNELTRVSSRAVAIPFSSAVLANGDAF